MNSQASTILIKIGGSTLSSNDTSLIDITSLHNQGNRPVVVHGGGDLVSEWMTKHGIQTQFVQGLRVTNEQGLDVAVAVLAGLVNKQTVASLQALGGPAIGLSGADGACLQASINRPELGYVGGDLKVNVDPILALLEANYIPVIAPIAIQNRKDSNKPYQLLNVNADTVAGALAVALGVSRLMFLTDVEGILDGSGHLISRIPYPSAKHLLETGIVTSGMIPKLDACIYAKEHKIPAHIIDGRRRGSLLDCVNGIGIGTEVV